MRLLFSLVLLCSLSPSQLIMRGSGGGGECPDTGACTDAFTNSNGTGIEAHNAKWVLTAGTGNGLEIQSNALRPTADAIESVAHWDATFSADQYSQFTVTKPASTTAYWSNIVRADASADTFYLCKWEASSASDWQVFIQKHVAGTPTNLVSSSTGGTPGVSNGSVLRMEITGVNPGTIRCLLDDVEKATTTDSDIDSGMPGIDLYMDTRTDGTVDNWEGGNL